MSPDQALRLCRLAKAISPAQAVDDFTPEAWALVLREVRYEDAELALGQLGAETEWIHVSHIVARVKRIRRDRVNDFGPLPQPPADLDPDNVPAHQRWLADITRRIADGEDVEKPEPAAAVTAESPVIKQLGTVGQSIPDRHLALRQKIADDRARMAVPEPEPLLRPTDHSREPEPTEEVA